MELVKTRAQVERERKHTMVINMFLQLRRQNQLASAHKIMSTVGSKLGYTSAGVRKILEQNNVPMN